MINKNAGSLREVEELSKELVARKRFPTMEQARAYVYESRPALAAAVRRETAAAEAVNPASAPAGAMAEVDKAAHRLMDANVAPTIQQARARVFAARPKLAQQVREEQK